MKRSVEAPNTVAGPLYHIREWTGSIFETGPTYCGHEPSLGETWTGIMGASMSIAEIRNRPAMTARAGWRFCGACVRKFEAR